MDSQASSLVFFVCFLLFSSAATAFNITRLLSRFPEFSTMNGYLTQTKLNQLINSRNTITVLALDNSAIGGLSGKSIDEIKNILSVHVVLDYYDIQKLTNLPKKTTTLTTMFQSSGVAGSQQGFLSVSAVNEGEVVFGSAEKGAKLTSKLVKAVAAQPYNISVLQISSPILPPGLDFKGSASPKTSPAPKASTPVAAPAKSPALAPTPTEVAEGPTPAAEPTMAPDSDAPMADAPAPNSVAPVSDVPAGSPVSDAPADAPALTPESPSSGSSRAGVAASGFLVVMGLVSALIAL